MHGRHSCTLNLLFVESPVMCLTTQDLVEQFFKTNAASSFRKPWHRLTALPDAYNYKVLRDAWRTVLCCPCTADPQQAHSVCHVGRCHGIATFPPAPPALFQAYWGEPEAGWLSMFTHQVRCSTAGHLPGRVCCVDCVHIHRGSTVAGLACYMQQLLFSAWPFRWETWSLCTPTAPSQS